MNIKAKETTLQIMRGFAIVLVLIRHAIARIPSYGFFYYLEQLIICLHMPVFFVIAGYLFEKKIKQYKSYGAKNFFANKARRLLVPYLFWTIVLWIFMQALFYFEKTLGFNVLSKNFLPMSVTQLLIGLVTYKYYYTEHLWFLYVLFVFFILNYFLSFCKNRKIWCFLSLIIGFSTCFVNYPNIVNKMFYWLIFFVIGRMIGTDKDHRLLKSIKSGYILILFLITCIFRLLLLDTSYILCEQALKYLVGFEGVYLIYVISKKIGVFKFFNSLMQTIGNYSYQIYLLHNPYFVAFPCTILSKWGGGTISINHINFCLHRNPFSYCF